MKRGPYSFGSDNWPGLAKLIEECGEVMQVAGKIMASGGDTDHWDGTNLLDRMVEEMGDAMAAITCVAVLQGVSGRVEERAFDKMDLFSQWHQDNNA